MWWMNMMREEKNFPFLQEERPLSEDKAEEVGGHGPSPHHPQCAAGVGVQVHFWWVEQGASCRCPG